MPTATWKCRPLHIKAPFRRFDPAYNIPYGFCGRKAPWKKEQTRVSEQRHYTTLAVVSLVWTTAKKQGEPGTRSSPSMSTADSVFSSKASELCESPGLPVPNSPYGLYGRKARLDLNFQGFNALWKCSRVHREFNERIQTESLCWDEPVDNPPRRTSTILPFCCYNSFA